jgi:hypothetical protein
MQTVFIKFLNRDEQIRGYYKLAMRARVSSLPHDLYQVPIEALKLLDADCIAYRRATDDEVRAAHVQVRDPSAAVL